MKQIFFTVLILGSLVGCNNKTEKTGVDSEPTETFRSEMVNGKYTTDFTTGQELKGMRITIENFTLLNKKKFENLKAYQQFGDLMQSHIDRVTASCNLDADSKSLLCKKLDKMKPEINTLHGDDMVKSKQAVKNINLDLAEIDSAFSYNNN